MFGVACKPVSFLDGGSISGLMAFVQFAGL